MSNRKQNKKKREPINFDEFKYDKPTEDDESSQESEKEREIDCCDRCLFSSFGFILIYIGILVLFFNERDHKYSQRDISYITSNLQLLDIENQKPSEINTLLDTVVENKYPIHFIDTISNVGKDMIVMDDRTDLSYPGLALKIHTEMYQWVETEETLRKEGTTQTESKYTYSKQWSSTFHDSSNFNQKDDFYNPQPTVSQLSTRNVWVDDIIIGNNQHIQFHLSKSLYTKLSKRSLWKNVTQKAADYSEMEAWEMRDGYLFRPYDKAESWYAEPEKKGKAEDEETEQEEAEDVETESEGDENDDDGADKGDGDDDVLKGGEENEERVRLDKPRTMIGDIRMTVFALDTRGEVISYLGGMKLVEDWGQRVLIPWKSPTNHKFSMLEYGKISHEEAIDRFSTENVFRLWLSRGFTLIFMWIGFMILPNVLNTTVLMMKLPVGSVPFESWTMSIMGAGAISVLLWIVIVAIAYIVGIIHLALTFVVLIMGRIFLNNKAVTLDEDEKDKQAKTKKEKKQQ